MIKKQVVYSLHGREKQDFRKLIINHTTKAKDGKFETEEKLLQIRENPAQSSHCETIPGCEHCKNQPGGNTNANKSEIKNLQPTKK